MFRIERKCVSRRFRKYNPQGRQPQVKPFDPFDYAQGRLRSGQAFFAQGKLGGISTQEHKCTRNKDLRLRAQ